jgi:ankyrin repeat protein
MTQEFLDFVRVVTTGDIDQVSRCLDENPAFATESADVGATRQVSAPFFFTNISHYLYAGDTALHMAAAAFQRAIATLLVERGADCRAKNRRGAEPLHYAADTNRSDPIAQADTIAYLISSAPIRMHWIARACHRCTAQCGRDRRLQCELFSMVMQIRGCRTNLGRHRCISPFTRQDAAAAALRTQRNNRPPSSVC